MRRNRVLSLLLAAIIMCGMYMPAGAIGEDIYFAADDPTYWENDDGLLDGLFETEVNFYDEDVFSETDEWGAAVQSPVSQPLNEQNALAKPVSDFVILDNVLVKYQGTSSSVTVPEGVRVICCGAFAGNRAIVSVSLPDSVVEIEGGAFENCVNLQTIRISENSRLSTIGMNAFKGCPMLNNSFEQKVKNVSTRAFEQKTVVPSSTISPVSSVTNVEKQFEKTNAVAYDESEYVITKNSKSQSEPIKPTVQTPSERTSTLPQAPVQVSASGSLEITRQPVSVQAEIGDSVAFIVVAEGSDSIQYQWMQQSRSGGDWSEIEDSSTAFQNASTNVLSFTVTNVRANRRFKCVITDGISTVESKTVFVILSQEGNLVDSDSSVRYDPFDESPFVPSLEDFGLVSEAAIQPEQTGNEYPFAPQPGKERNLEQLSFDAESRGLVPVISALQVNDSSVKVYWTEVKNAAGYELYRSVNGGELALISTLTETSYLDDGLDFTANTYRYYVRVKLSAVTSPELSENPYSNEAEALALSAPSAVFAWQETADTAKVFWNPVNNATGYELYRRVNDEDYILVNQTTEITYLDKDLDFSQNRYAYRVMAVLSVPEADVYIKSDFSEPAEVETPDISPKQLELDGVVYTATLGGAVVTAYKGNAESLAIPSVVTIQNESYTVVGIGPAVFKGNKSLKKITLPNTIQTIETAAFAYCSAMIDQ